MDKFKLNALLANVAVLKQKAYNFHWNLRGKDFLVFHKATEGLYEGLIEIFDDVAEKIAMQGGTPLSTYGDYISVASLEEVQPKAWSSTEICDAVVSDLDTLEGIAKEVITSATIQPLLDEIFVFIDKQRWFFRASK